MTDPVLSHLVQHQGPILDWLKSFLRIPSVSADPAFARSMGDARDLVIERLQAMGLQDVQVLEGGGHPAVYGSWTGAPGRPTVMIYGHYDVQPAEPLAQWRTPPFEPTEVDGRLYARGASDVKGSTTIALEAVAAFLAVEGGCPVNVKVFLEGEEETGSPTLRPLIERHRALLQADAVLSADGGRASADVPTVNTGARGNGQFEVRLRTASKDLHSGRYGGAVRNALHDMAALVASLHTADGHVAVDGFLDGVAEPTERQRADTAALPFDAKAFVAEVGGVAHGEAGYSLRERLTLRPALDVNGMWGGYTGTGGKTIIPCEAGAKFTVRVVGGQDARRVMERVLRHLQDRCAPGVSLDLVDMNDGSPASTLAADHPLVKAAESVLQQETGRRPVHVRLGATVPITAIFKEALGLDTLMFGFNLPDEDVHAPNEFFRLKSIDEGLRCWVLLLRELARHAPESFRDMPHSRQCG